MSCSLALAGNREEAFDTLRNAVEDGYTDRTDTETDGDLVSFHTDPRWQTLLNARSDLKQLEDRRWGNVLCGRRHGCRFRSGSSRKPGWGSYQRQVRAAAHVQIAGGVGPRIRC
jgi:hypothetical protein